MKRSSTDCNSRLDVLLRAFVLSALAWIAPASGQSRPLTEPSQAADSLARHTPASVGLFVELRDPADLLIPLVDPELWTTLAELAGQPARSDDAKEWAARIQRTIDMSPEEAIRSLFARRVAFLGAGAGRSQDAVVLCEPHEGAAAELLTRRKPARLEDIAGPPTYHLYAGLGVSVQDDRLAFGDLVPEHGLFRAFLSESARAMPGPRLADDRAFRALAARVPDHPDGVLFARLRAPRPAATTSPAPSDQPAANPVAIFLPGALRGSDNLMVAFKRDGSKLHLFAVGDAPAAKPASRATTAAAPRNLFTGLPPDTLGAWAGEVDFPGLLDQVERLPSNDPLRSILTFAKSNDVPRKLAQSLGPEACIAVGTANPPGRPADAPPVPAVALLVRVTDRDAARHGFQAVADSLVNLLNLLVLARGEPPIPDAQTRENGGDSYQFLDFSQLVQRVDHNAVGELHGCWTVSRDTLVVASHEQFMKDILRMRPEKPSLATVADALDKPLGKSGNHVVVQSGPLASLAANWLAFFQRTAPQAMDERWWRSRQPAGSAVRLGIDVDSKAAAADPAGRPTGRLPVRGVNPSLPAAGRVLPGDVLLGCDGKRFATTQPWVEMRETLENRTHPNYVDVQLERAGRVRVERLPVPFFDPIQALRRIEAIGRIVRRLTYYDESPAVDARKPDSGGRGFLTVELAKSAAGDKHAAARPASTSAPTSSSTGAEPSASSHP